MANKVFHFICPYFMHHSVARTPERSDHRIQKSESLYPSDRVEFGVNIHQLNLTNQTYLPDYSVRPLTDLQFVKVKACFSIWMQEHFIGMF